MNESRRSMMIWLLAGTAVLYAGGIAISYASGKVMPVAVWVLIPAYAALTYLLFSIIMGSGKKSPQRFVAAVNGSVTIKLLLTAAIAGGYFVSGMPHRKAFALALFCIYLIFTAILLKVLLPALRQPQS
jgi:hypothetical protein